MITTPCVKQFILSLMLIIGGIGNAAAAPCNFRVSITKVDVDCYGNATGSATANVTGTTGGYKYLWSNGQTTQTISNLTAQTYFVKVTDAIGCEVIEFIEIKQPPKLRMIHEVDHVLCHGDNSGEIRLNITGGMGSYSVIWPDGTTASTNSNLYAGTYIPVVTDENYCEVSDTITVRQPSPLRQTHVIREVTGYGLSDGAIDITVEGGVRPYRYQWTSPEGFSDTLEDVYNIPSANYLSRVLDFNDCVLETEIFIYQPPPLEATFRIVDVNCKDGIDGEIDMTVTGGVPPYTYVWANSLIVLNKHTAHIKELTTDWYTVTITDDNGITLSDSIFVDQPIDILTSLIPTDANCYGSSDGRIDLTVSGGVPPYTFQWSNGHTSQNLFDVEAGDYSVLIVDYNGCSLVAEETIGHPDEIIIQETLSHVTCKDHHDGIIDLNVYGGIPGYSYNWSHGETSRDVSNLPGGNYKITVEDQHNCIMEKDFLISVPDIGCIWIPNAFTPNNDGINDVWEIRNYYLYPDVTVRVFSKRGNEVFSSVGYNNPWDGTHNGRDVPSGTYYYVVNTREGHPPYTGSVTIVR